MDRFPGPLFFNPAGGSQPGACLSGSRLKPACPLFCVNLEYYILFMIPRSNLSSGRRIEYRNPRNTGPDSKHLLGGMKMNTNIMKDAAALIVSISVLLLLIFNLAFGQTPGSQYPGSPCERDGLRPGGVDFEGHGHPPVGPPPEAYSACKDKMAGSASRLITPWGETVRGTCREEGGKLVLIPDRPEGVKMAMRPCPPPRCWCDLFPMPQGCGGLFPPPLPPEREDIDMIPPPRYGSGNAFRKGNGNDPVR